MFESVFNKVAGHFEKTCFEENMRTATSEAVRLKFGLDKFVKERLNYSQNRKHF